MSTEPSVSIDERRALTVVDIADLDALIHVVTDADGVRPLDEHVTLHIRQGGDHGAQHLLARTASTDLVGYAHLDATDEVAGPVAEVVVHPDYRRNGIGRLLVNALLANSSDGRLRLWAHGEDAASARLAESMGFTRSRVLWQMRRSLFAPLPRVNLPDGVRIRTFEPGVDDQAWLEVNARAFAQHPEQGRWIIDDLRLRLAEPWFDPQGFLLAVTGEGPDEKVLGFHWTKVHGGATDEHGHEHLGEVYIVGVDPTAQRGGLGRALTVAGLSYLRARGLTQAMLYVDAVNTNAITVYESLGFARWDTDVMFTR